VVAVFQLLSPAPFAFTALSSIDTVIGEKFNVVKLKTKGCVVVGGLNGNQAPSLLRYS
jgi:hypothetical protein